MANNELNLLPCPHCGSKNIIVKTRKTTIVECVECESLVIKTFGADAIAAWNRRAAPAQAELSDAQIDSMWRNSCDVGGMTTQEFTRHFARAIESRIRGQQGGSDAWISVGDRLPEVGVGVMVYSPPLTGEGLEDYRLDFDCIDPNDDDHASWLNHNESYEHFCCVAKPEGSTGPKEKAPYTHWQPLPPPPAIQAQAGDATMGGA